jgi:hypothetical protein
LIHRFSEVTHDAVVQGADAVNLIGEGRYENCRNRVARTDKASIKFEPGHRGHVDVGDQASRFVETRGREKLGRRRKNIDHIAQRPHEPSHGFAKELIIFNDRNQ